MDQPQAPSHLPRLSSVYAQFVFSFFKNCKHFFTLLWRAIECRRTGAVFPHPSKAFYKRERRLNDSLSITMNQHERSKKATEFHLLRVCACTSANFSHDFFYHMCMWSRCYLEWHFRISNSTVTQQMLIYHLDNQTKKTPTICKWNEIFLRTFRLQEQ